MKTIIIAAITFILGANIGVLLMCLLQAGADAERRWEDYAGRSGEPGGEPGDQYDKAEPADGDRDRPEISESQKERETEETDKKGSEAAGAAPDQAAEGSPGAGRETDREAADRPDPLSEKGGLLAAARKPRGKRDRRQVQTPLNDRMYKKMHFLLLGMDFNSVKC